MGLTNGDSMAELQVLALQMDIGCFVVSLFNSTLELIIVVSYCKSQSKKKPVSIRHPVFARSQLAFSAVSIGNSALCLKGWKVALFCFFSTGWAHFELNWQTFCLLRHDKYLVCKMEGKVFSFQWWPLFTVPLFIYFMSYILQPAWKRFNPYTYTSFRWPLLQIVEVSSDLSSFFKCTISPHRALVVCNCTELCIFQPCTTPEKGNRLPQRNQNPPPQVTFILGIRINPPPPPNPPPPHHLYIQ